MEREGEGLPDGRNREHQGRREWTSPSKPGRTRRPDADAVGRESGFREWQGLTKRDRDWTFWDKKEPPIGFHPEVRDLRVMFSQTHCSPGAMKWMQEGEPGARVAPQSQTAAQSLAASGDHEPSHPEGLPYAPPTGSSPTFKCSYRHQALSLVSPTSPEALRLLGWTRFYILPTSPTQTRNFRKHGA